jgi:translation elongation factor EF-G
VNKIDRGGAHGERVLADIAHKLSPAVVAMGSADGQGRRSASYTPHTAADGGFTARLTDLLAEHDDALLSAYVRDETSVSYGRLRRGLAAQTGRALVHPVFFGSETVHETLRQGLHGWQVTDCSVTLTHTGYWPRQSHAHARLTRACQAPPRTSAGWPRWC